MRKAQCKYTILGVVVSLLLCGCSEKKPAYKEKTLQERQESYHSELTTSDLRMFHLRGNVRAVDAEALFLSYMPNGMLESAVYGGDSLRIVRNGSGEIIRLETHGGDDLTELLKNADLSRARIEYYSPSAD